MKKEFKVESLKLRVNEDGVIILIVFTFHFSLFTFNFFCG